MYPKHLSQVQNLCFHICIVSLGYLSMDQPAIHAPQLILSLRNFCNTKLEMEFQNAFVWKCTNPAVIPCPIYHIYVSKTQDPFLAPSHILIIDPLNQDI